jgi:hypothetical protein
VGWELSRQPKRAAKVYAEAVSLLEELVKDFPRTTDYRHQLARAYTLQGLLFASNGDLEQADAVRAKARRHWERLVKDAPDFPAFRQELARSRVDLAEERARADKPAEAKAALLEAIELQEALVKQFDANAEYRTDLARSLLNLGQLKQGAAEEAEYRRAAALLEQARPKSGPPPAGWLNLRLRVQRELIVSLNQRGELGKLAEALLPAIRYQGEVVAVSPADVKARQALQSYHSGLLKVLGHLRDHAAISRVVKAYAPLLRAAGSSAAEKFVEAAERVARCLPLAEKDKGLSAEKRREVTRAYGEQAMGLLREAVQRGYRDADRLRTAADLQPLAERADFRELVKGLEGKGGGKP